MGDGARLTIATNLGAAAVEADVPQTRPIWGLASGNIPPRSTVAWIEPP
jgi:hypothetical protein